METIGIIIGIIFALILFAVLATYLTVLYTTYKIKKRAEKFIEDKGVETFTKITKKYLDKK